MHGDDFNAAMQMQILIFLGLLTSAGNEDRRKEK
jgi:hypothetical protein